MAYCQASDVTAEIGSNYDPTSDLTTANVTEFIVQADGKIDQAASRHYWPFNAHDSTPATPEHVKRASIDLATALSLQKLRATSRGSGLSDRIEFYFERARMALEELASASAWIEPESVSSETLPSFSTPTWGWELDDTEVFLASTSPLDSGDPPHIFRESVAILSTSTPGGDVTFSAAQMADMRLGDEYDVVYRPEYRRWVFCALYSDLNKVTTLNISYNWDYRRHFANERLRSGAFIIG